MNIQQCVQNGFIILTLALCSCGPNSQVIDVYLDNNDVLCIENRSHKQIENFDTIRCERIYRTVFFESYISSDLRALDFLPKENSSFIEELIIRSDLRKGLILDLCKYGNLKKLDMSSCSLSSECNLNCTFPHLTSLDLSRNDYDIIPLFVYQFPNIERMNLKNTNIYEFSIDVSRLPHLKQIDLRNTPIEAKADSLRKVYPAIDFVTVL